MQRETIMKMINITKLLAVSSIISVSILQVASAHPGRTAADGCHYCRTNCDSWGVPWNERHCHGTNNIDKHSDLLTVSHNPATHTHEADFLHVETGNHVNADDKN